MFVTGLEINVQSVTIRCSLFTSLAESIAMQYKCSVIVTDLVSQNPYPRHSFVSGVPLSPTALGMANIEAADYIFVFANLRFADPDIKTLHVATRVLSLNQKATVFVEMIDPKNDLLKYASSRVKPLGSRKLVEAVLRDGHISAESWEKMCFGS